MKKLGLALLCSILVAALLTASFINANAMDAGNPTVSSLSGDQDFTTLVIPLDRLPGTTILSNGLFVPLGFPAGETQFEGEGIVVDNLNYGSAMACFPIRGTHFGWGGQIGRWNGNRWILMPTSITREEESLAADACTTITLNGTYALIRWIVDSSVVNVREIARTPEPTFVITGTAWYTTELTGTTTPMLPTDPTQVATTDTPGPTNTNTEEPTTSGTQTPTDAFTWTPTNTETPTPTATNTETPTAAATGTPAPTNTDTPMSTNTYTPTPADTDTPTPTAINSASPTPTFTYTPAQSTSSLVFTPIADAYVRQASPSTNFGSNIQLWVQAFTGASYQSYLKFSVSGVSGVVSKATLRVYATSSCADGPAVYPSKTNWTETGVKWNNRPDLTGSALDDKGGIAMDTWVEFDVTSLVTSDGTFSFGLIAGSDYASSFSSREGSNDPQLVVDFGP